MDNSSAGWGFLIIVVAIILGVMSFFGFNWGTTYTGSVDINDCRANVELKAGDWETYWGKFYCSWGECTAVSLSSNGTCDTYYSYSQPVNTSSNNN